MVKCSRYNKSVCPSTCNHLGYHEPNNLTNPGDRCNSVKDYCVVIKSWVTCKAATPKIDKKEKAKREKLEKQTELRKKRFIKEYRTLCLKHGCSVEAKWGEEHYVITEVNKQYIDDTISEMEKS